MDINGIGKLERVSLRQVWPHEAYDFSRWLHENIEVLNDMLGLEMVNVQRERPAGPFSIDLIAEDADNNTVIIENQLEKSNHDHLGKVITYLAAMEAKAAIWIVSEPRPEHVAALAWLNDSSSAAFYMVKVEAVRIGDSPAAPLLTLIVGPSENAKEVMSTKKDISDVAILRKQWWTQLIERSANVSKLHAHLTPGQHYWIGISTGIRGINLNYIVNQDECAAELYIDRGTSGEIENKPIFDQLEAHKEEIEKEFGRPLSWQRLDQKRACRIRYTQPGGGYSSSQEEWPAIQDGVIRAMNRLEQAIRPYLTELKIAPEIVPVH